MHLRISLACRAGRLAAPVRIGQMATADAYEVHSSLRKQRFRKPSGSLDVAHTKNRNTHCPLDSHDKSRLQPC